MTGLTAIRARYRRGSVGPPEMSACRTALPRVGALRRSQKTRPLVTKGAAGELRAEERPARPSVTARTRKPKGPSATNFSRSWTCRPISTCRPSRPCFGPMRLAAASSLTQTLKLWKSRPAAPIMAVLRRGSSLAIDRAPTLAWSESPMSLKRSSEKTRPLPHIIAWAAGAEAGACALGSAGMVAGRADPRARARVRFSRFVSVGLLPRVHVRAPRTRHTAPEKNGPTCNVRRLRPGLAAATPSAHGH